MNLISNMLYIFSINIIILKVRVFIFYNIQKLERTSWQIQPKESFNLIQLKIYLHNFESMVIQFLYLIYLFISISYITYLILKMTLLQLYQFNFLFNILIILIIVYHKLNLHIRVTIFVNNYLQNFKNIKLICDLKQTLTLCSTFKTQFRSQFVLLNQPK